MEDLKVVVASNLIRLRTDAGMTQSELAEQLHYSDKSVSKWERAESLPDLAVTSAIAAIFGVSVDFLLNTHDTWVTPTPRQTVNTRMITAVAMVGIWTLAALIYVILWLTGRHLWLVFVAALPVSLVTLLVLNTLWNQRRGNLPIVMLLVASLFSLVYCCLLALRPWQLLLLLVPAELLVILSFHIRPHPPKKED